MDETISIRFEDNRNRAAAYDGNQEVGCCTYSVDGDVWVLEHTFVDPAYGGHGLARKLVDCVVRAARDSDVKILPVCSYAASLFKKDKQYDDVKADI
jgi:predicted GNAT family acetyltransferase